MAECSLDYCSKPSRRRGMCGMHYQRMLRGMDLNFVNPLSLPTKERFFTKVNKSGGYPDFTDPLVRVTEADGECWVWTGAPSAMGYGIFGVGGKQVKAHRFSLEISGAEVEGLVVDHLCRRHSCVRPSHLEATDQLENVRRGATAFSMNGLDRPDWSVVPTIQAFEPEDWEGDRCPSGHAKVDENRRKRLIGTDCAACHRERERRRYQSVGTGSPEYKLRLKNAAESKRLSRLTKTSQYEKLAVTKKEKNQP